MLNKKGYTTAELLIVVVVFTVIYLIGAINVTHAFENDAEQDSYDSLVSLMELQTEKYIENNMDLLENSDEIFIYAKDLVEAKYIAANEDGDIVNPLNPDKNLNNLKFRVTLKDEKVKVNLVQV